MNYKKLDEFQKIGISRRFLHRELQIIIVDRESLNKFENKKEFNCDYYLSGFEISK